MVTWPISSLCEAKVATNATGGFLRSLSAAWEKEIGLLLKVFD